MIRSLSQESPEVYYSDDVLVAVDAAEVGRLKTFASGNIRKRSRLCAHCSPTEPVHEMVIVHEHGEYVRPHKHIGKSESMHVIEGDADVAIFHEGGELESVFSIGDFASGKPFFYRMNSSLFHMLIIRSNVLVFHETTSGPFVRAACEFPLWAPDGSDPTQTASYLKQIECRISDFSK